MKNMIGSFVLHFEIFLFSWDSNKLKNEILENENLK